MEKPPTNTNETAGKVNAVIGSAGNGIVAIVEKMMLVEAPFLGLPVIKQLWQLAMNWVAGFYIRAAQEGATFLVIDHQIDEEQDAMSAALSALIAAEKTGNSEAIKKAIDDYAKAHAAMVQSDGSASLH